MSTDEVFFYMNGHAFLTGFVEAGDSFEEVCAEEEIFSVVASVSKGDREGEGLMALLHESGKAQFLNILLLW